MASFGYHLNSEENGHAFSLPYDLGYHGAEGKVIDDNKPRILLLGLRRTGKTSIENVVFHKMAPNETLFLEPTNQMMCDDVSNRTFVQFQICDTPGDWEPQDSEVDTDTLFKAAAMIFVIDALEDDYQDALLKLHSAVVRAYQVNPKIRFEVFIHKVDGLNEDRKLEVQRDIHQQTMDDLFNSKLEGIHLNFCLTSIYDHSIFEAFSKVVQKLIPQLPTLENLLDTLNSNCRMEKAFLIDVHSKIYVATDSSPVDMQIYELCSDMIDVVLDVSCIYGVRGTPDYYDSETQSMIKLDNQKVLYLRQVNRYLALVCLMRHEKDEKQGLLDYNFSCLKKAILEVFDVH
eukprot:TRINITY_DN3115_c0_g1_i7.p1 TRINITY_DN3115_c0_g1~~TRINITY_DN3115_c0_g1_i7.p1  ORF type:complete len:345 (+),score=56.25 TRINITY_DN3115_c0_g1_i7:85-1119(+)